MAKERTLFGKKIVSNHLLNYSEQVHDILRTEIEAGRWEVNESLPGVMQLAKQLHFGTKTIQMAYEKLKKEGYIVTRGYRGTYVKELHPDLKADSDFYGILMSSEQTGQPLIQWYEHVILEKARSHGFRTEVKILPEAMLPEKALQAGELFHPEVEGVISLVSFRSQSVRKDDTDRRQLPVVFLCPPFEAAYPKVSADIYQAYYELTSRMIELGFSKLLYSEDSLESDPRQTKLHYSGYCDAMKDHGMPLHPSFLEHSRGVNNYRFDSIRSHLEEALKPVETTPGPVVIIADSLGRNMAINRYAGKAGIKIPGDLSVVSTGTAYLRGNSGPQLTGMLPDFDYMVTSCLNILKEMIKTGKCHLSSLNVHMDFIPGHTCAPSYRGKSSQQKGRQFIDSVHPH
jgi:GntR family transcriptional regulator of arabinose operon